FRVEEVDHRGQCPRQLVAVAGEGGLRRRLAGCGCAVQLAGIQAELAARRPAGAAEEGLDAVVETAVAASCGAVRRAAPGQGVVAPLASNGVRSAEQLAVDDDAATDAGA